MDDAILAALSKPVPGPAQVTALCEDLPQAVDLGPKVKCDRRAVCLDQDCRTAFAIVFSHPAEKWSLVAELSKGGAHERVLSGLDAAAKLLEEAAEPLSCKAVVERAFEKGYWQSGGNTPAATIYAAMLREVQKKGHASRFRKAARGRFALAK